jgi:hypothetical protein
VTGRIAADLRGEFTDVDEYFDALVVENGAVLSRGDDDRMLAEPVDVALDEAVRLRGVHLERGDVLVACGAEHAPVVFEEVGRLGLDCQLLHNRGSLMVLPAGVTKETGLRAALAELGLSPHDAVGVGDGENDHALLHACEIGVAVADAVEPLRAHADIVLDHPDGRGVVELLDGPLLGSTGITAPTRWSVVLGTTSDGTPVRVPASRVNVLIAGPSGTGKSYLAGVVAEQLVRMGYSILVLDPEGDHAGLGALAGVVHVNRAGSLPSVDLVVQMLHQSLASVVVDLSGLTTGTRHAYVAKLVAAVADARDRWGVPHWVVVDEAHVPLAAEGAARRYFRPGDTGWCLVTYRPGHLGEEIVRCLDVAVGLVTITNRTRQPCASWPTWRPSRWPRSVTWRMRTKPRCSWPGAPSPGAWIASPSLSAAHPTSGTGASTSTPRFRRRWDFASGGPMAELPVSSPRTWRPSATSSVAATTRSSCTTLGEATSRGGWTRFSRTTSRRRSSETWSVGWPHDG